MSNDKPIDPATGTAYKEPAKVAEQKLLESPPEYPLGRECGLCKDRFWKKDFYAHVDEHLDDINWSNRLIASHEADIVFDQEKYAEF